MQISLIYLSFLLFERRSVHPALSSPLLFSLLRHLVKRNVIKTMYIYRSDMTTYVGTYLLVIEELVFLALQV